MGGGNKEGGGWERINVLVYSGTGHPRDHHRGDLLAQVDKYRTQLGSTVPISL